MGTGRRVAWEVRGAQEGSIKFTRGVNHRKSQVGWSGVQPVIMKEGGTPGRSYLFGLPRRRSILDPARMAGIGEDEIILVSMRWCRLGNGALCIESAEKSF